MSETYTISAKTVDEAVDLASKLYGGKNKEISHDIISLPKKGFLGFGSKDAVIRVTVTDTEDDGLESIVNEIKNYKNQTAPESGYEASEKKEKSKAPKAQKPEQSKPEQKKPEQSKSEQKKPEQPKETKQKAEGTSPAEKPAAQPEQKKLEAKKPEVKKPEQKKPEQKKAEQSTKQRSQKVKNQKPAAEKNTAPVLEVKAEEPRAADVKIKNAVSEDEMKFAVEFINAMIENMKLSAVAIPVSAPEGEEYTKTDTETVYPAINIDGEDTGILIGHHGETLDAIQYLVNLALFRKSNSERGRENIKITVDIENYREKREDTLRALARRMAARAVKYKRNVFLEPMNPYERRIIHSELQEYPDVATHSVGSDTNRKIIITYEGTDKSVPQKKRGGKGHKRGGGHGKPEGKAPEKTVSEPAVPQGLPLPTLDDVL